VGDSFWDVFTWHGGHCAVCLSHRRLSRCYGFISMSYFLCILPLSGSCQYFTRRSFCLFFHDAAHSPQVTHDLRSLTPSASTNLPMRHICMMILPFICALGLGLSMLSAVPPMSLLRPLSRRTTRMVRYRHPLIMFRGNGGWFSLGWCKACRAKSS